ncbi:hypothetical protein ACH5RR_038426 [Cinchona calisaya]|uniref:F-box protein n=1 Tax=Cinchona calisaya TaxID=153742 RepID=A0ABD2XVV1_9GENT
MKMMRKPNWSDLQHDVLELIAQCHIKIEDCVAFGAVCTSWRAASSANNFKGLRLPQKFPCLMLVEDNDNVNHDHPKYLEEWHGGRYMGAYNLETRTIEPFTSAPKV